MYWRVIPNQLNPLISNPSQFSYSRHLYYPITLPLVPQEKAKERTSITVSFDSDYRNNTFSKWNRLDGGFNHRSVPPAQHAAPTGGRPYRRGSQPAVLVLGPVHVPVKGVELAVAEVIHVQ